MHTESPRSLNRLANRLEVILSKGPVPNEEELPYLMNLAAVVAEDYPGLGPAEVLAMVADDVRRGLA
jgi:hypothetical protein